MQRRHSDSDLEPSNIQGVRVLSSPGRWEQDDNPFLKLLFASYGDNIDLINFNWWCAFTGSYDLLHVHWPEFLMRGSSPIRTFAKLLLFAALTLKVRMFSIPTIWTVHNEEPHEGGGRLEAAVFDIWTKSVTHKVYLSKWAAEHDTFLPEHGSVIRHGHYRPILNQEYPARNVIPSSTVRLLFFGFLRPWKGIEGLIDAFSSINSIPGIRAELRIVGKTINADYSIELSDHARPWPAITLVDEFLGGAGLQQEVAYSDLVVLPYSKMYSSGAVLLALSVGRPVLVPESPTMKELQEEVGEDWVRMFVAPLGPGLLERQVKSLCGREIVGDPMFCGREWSAIGASYTALFLKLARDGRTR